VLPEDATLIGYRPMTCGSHRRPASGIPRDLYIHLKVPPYRWIKRGGSGSRFAKEDLPWDRPILSNEVHIRYVDPTGIDKEAYDSFGGTPMRSRNRGSLIKDYPASTYAAYVVFDTFGAAARGVPSRAVEVFEGLWTRKDREWASVPDDTGESRDGWRSLWGDEVWQTADRWIRQVLADHPEIWFADELRLARAVRALRAQHYAVARKAFQQLTEASGNLVATSAGQYLSLMVAHGMIKPSAIPAELRAKLPPVEAAKKPAAVNK